jgi:hypothetical protein
MILEIKSDIHVYKSEYSSFSNHLQDPIEWIKVFNVNNLSHETTGRKHEMSTSGLGMARIFFGKDCKITRNKYKHRPMRLSN